MGPAQLRRSRRSRPDRLRALEISTPGRSGSGAYFRRGPKSRPSNAMPMRRPDAVGLSRFRICRMAVRPDGTRPAVFVARYAHIAVGGKAERLPDMLAPPAAVAVGLDRGRRTADLSSPVAPGSATFAVEHAHRLLRQTLGRATYGESQPADTPNTGRDSWGGARSQLWAVASVGS
jgi:hypothetical protein